MYCPFCGVEIPNSSAFCGFCGKKIPASEAAQEPAAEAVEQAVEAAAEPVAEAVEQAVEAAAEPAAEAVEQAVEAAAEPAAEAVEQAAEAAAEPVAEAVEQAVEAVPEPVAEAVEQAAEAAAEPVAEVVEQIVEAVAEPVSETVENGAVSVLEPDSNTLESADASVLEPVSNTLESAAASVPEPVADTVEQAAEAAAEPAAEAAEQAAEAVAEAADQSEVPSGGSVSYSEPGDAAFEELSDDKGIKARRAFSITSLLKNKLFLMCAAGILIFVILFAVIINAAVSSSDKNPLKGFYYSVYADGETVFLYNGNVVKGTDFSGNCKIAAMSRDGTAALVVDGESLTLLSGGKVNKITDELSNGNAILSDNGKTVVYVEDEELTAYSGSKKTKIADLGGEQYTDFVISPDGSTVVFSEYNSSSAVKSVSAWNGKKVIDLDAKFRPVAVSNGGKIIYGIKNSGDLVYLKNLKAGSDEKIREISGVVDKTADNSGIIFTSSANTYYFDLSSDEAVKVTGRSITMLNNGGYLTPRENFKSFYAIGGNGVYRFTKKGSDFESDKIISGASRVRLSLDGKTFVYKDDDELIKVSASNTDKENVIGDEVYSYNADPGLKYIYYLDEDGDLRYASSKKTKISSDVRTYTVNNDGVCVFCNDDGDLYYSSKGGEKKKVTSISDVEQIALINGIVYVKADDTLYVSENGKTFKKTGVEF